MIIVKISGGLGNQMFQYAFGRSLALRRGEELKLDLHSYQKNDPNETPRQYKIDNFKIKAESASMDEMAGCSQSIYDKLAQKIGLKLWGDYHLRFHKRFYNSREKYFNSFFQSYKYFAADWDRISEDFQLAGEMPPVAQELEAQMKSENSVSVHIRRGDYVANPIYNQVHNICTPRYYAGGMDTVCSRTIIDKYYVFSDDVAWVKENISFNKPAVFVGDYKLEDFIELYLMSRCKHNIIANSSFSWWGAWLNNNPNKIVVAPQRWANIRNLYTGDILPPDWLKI